MDSFRHEKEYQNIYSKAPVSKRFLAFIIDWVLYTIPLLPGIIVLAVNAFDYREFNYSKIFSTKGYVFIGLVLIIIGYIFRTIYSFIKDGFSNGQSYGKRIMGLMVIDYITHMPISKKQSIIRRFIYIGLILIPIIGILIEPLLIIIDNKGRRFGDRIAGTLVINLEEYKG